MSIDRKTGSDPSGDGGGGDAEAVAGADGTDSFEENSASEPDRPGRCRCGICGGPAGGAADRFVASYPTETDAELAPADPDGLLPLCGGCADEVAELTDAWDAVGAPGVANAPSIADAFRAAVEDCSFCGDSAEGDVLGVESWPARPTADAADGHLATHYALCEGCVPIFEEFLRGIRPDCATRRRREAPERVRYRLDIKTIL